jgi:DNA-binding protein H-NS
MSTSLMSQLAKLRKEKELIEKKERALLSKTNSHAVSQIKAIMKQSGLTLEALLAGLRVKSELGKIEQGAGSKPKNSKQTKPSSRTKSKGQTKPRVSRAGIKVPIKFKHPSKSELTWTGRGKTPAWVSELEKAGKLEAAKVR